MKKILLLCPYPKDVAPSQRFRYEQYLSILQKNNFDVVIIPFLTHKIYSAIYQSGNTFSKIRAITHSYIRHYLLLLHASQFDFIFIHREVTPAGPPVLEWVLRKVLKKKIIYDFDDAIWVSDKTNESPFYKIIRWRSKVETICRLSYKISCGNSYLADYAKQFNKNVFINPTTIDTSNVHVQDTSAERLNEDIIIGWTGSHSTLKYLQSILSVLQSIERKYPKVKYLIIADVNPELPLANMIFRRWSKQTEITDLGSIDIGIMPLPDDEWTRGKCGFKALQYMAMQIPAVVSPVGVNAKIVEHGREGYWCSTDTEWFLNLEDLIINPEKRFEMGKRGRQKVIDHYSVTSNSANFLSLFQ